MRKYVENSAKDFPGEAPESDKFESKSKMDINTSSHEFIVPIEKLSDIKERIKSEIGYEPNFPSTPLPDTIVEATERHGSTNIAPFSETRTDASITPSPHGLHDVDQTAKYQYQEKMNPQLVQQVLVQFDYCC